jgi:hypothetical protein
MTDAATPANKPASKVAADAHDEKAPNPRRHYASPEDLREDINLDLATREDLLLEWRTDLDRRLESESEGMSASDPMSAEKESSLANEHKRVSNALEAVAAERREADAAG